MSRKQSIFSGALFTAKTFADQCLAMIQGDTAEITTAKIRRQANSAYNARLGQTKVAKEDLEDRYSTAQENLLKKLMNDGKELTSSDGGRENYLQNVYTARQNVLSLERELKAKDEEIDFLEDCLAYVQREAPLSKSI